jgi:hypothetical protein
MRAHSTMNERERFSQRCHNDRPTHEWFARLSDLSVPCSGTGMPVPNVILKLRYEAKDLPSNVTTCGRCGRIERETDHTEHRTRLSP